MPLIVINLVYTFLGSDISIPGHIGGLITGLAVGYGMAYAPQARRNVIQAGTVVAALVIFGIATAWQTHHIKQQELTASSTVSTTVIPAGSTVTAPTVTVQTR
jgi:hypothetical protein